MAIQQLTQPILNPIVAFDATKVSTIDFIVIGGAQVIGNRLVISDNQTGEQIYDKIQSTMKLEHSIPANTLKNGGYYNAVIYTIDSGGNESVASTAVPFYCYSQPVLTIDNIPTTETIENGTYAFTGSYLQQENEPLNSYQYILYDSNRNVLTQSDLIYYEANNSLSYTFVGMSNDTSYYVELIGQTINGTKVTSGLRYFTVRYLQPASFAICDLVNNCEDGYIQISSNIVAIDGKSNPDPPIYIDDKEVDLREPGSWVEWDEGFRIQDDFTMRVWGRDFNPYEEIITLTNDLNSDSKPNKIVLKWMIGDVIKSLPDYTNISDFNVNMQDSQNGVIENLMIGGNSVQKTSDYEVITESIQPMNFETQFSKKVSILPGGVSTQDIIEGEDGIIVEGESIEISDLDTTKENTLTVYGNSTQETRSGKNLTNYKDWITIGSVEEITKQEDDEIVCEIPANNSYGIRDIERTLKPNTAYTACVDYEFSQPLTSGYGLRVSYNGNYTAFNREGIVTFTTDETGLARMQLYVGIPYSGEAGILTVKNIRLYEGTYTKETIPEYEEYGAMPSPEYPSEIQNVEGNVNVTVANKNLFTGLVKGISINHTTGEEGKKNNSSASDFIKVNFDTNSGYYLSGLTNTISSYVAFYNKDKKYLGRTGGFEQLFIYFSANSFSSMAPDYENIEDKNITFVRITQYVTAVSPGTIDDIDNLQIQLETGATATNYVEHQEQTVTFPLAQGQKLMLGDYLAEDGIHHVRKQIELDGTENWELYSDKAARILKSDVKGVLNTTHIGNILSNYFKTETQNDLQTGIVDNGIAVRAEGHNGIVIRIADFTTLQEYKDWLSSKKSAGTPVIAEYELSEEVIEPYTEEQQEAYNQINSLSFYEGYNLITNESNAILNLHYNYIIASPSPTIPSEIQNVGDNINLFDKSNPNVLNAYISANKLTAESQNRIIWLPCNSNTTYTVSKKAGQKFAMYFSEVEPAIGVTVSGGVSNNTASTLTSTSLANSKYIVVYVANYNVGTEIPWQDVLDSLKIEEGAQPTAYSPYNCGNIDITVCNKNLAEIVNSINKNYIKMNDNGTFIINGTLQKNDSFRIISSLFLKSGTYRICLGTDYSNFHGSYFNISTTEGEIIKNFNEKDVTINIEKDCFINILIVLIAGTYSNLLVKPMIEKTESEVSSDWVEHQEQTITFPLAQGQKLMLGDYLADDGIHHVRKQVELDGTELVKIEQQNDNFARAYTNKYNDMKNYEENDNYTPASNFICSHFESVSNYSLVKTCVALNNQRIYITISKDIASTISEFKSYLAEQKQAGTPVILEYELAEEEIEAYTPEQQEAYNKLTNISSYSGENNVYSLINLPIPITVVTSIIPSPNNPSKIYSLGDRVNLINLNDFNITYNQQYSEDTNTNFILYPNYIYTLSFDYNVNNTTTDLYFSVGYGKDSYKNDISSENQYLNLYSGRNTVSFIVPDTINDGDYLWIKFAQTIILADVDVEISNIQLEKGFFATDYKSPNIYTIYPTSVQKNLYNYKTPIYIINNNTQYTDIQNGYSITLKKDNIDSSFAIGYKGILNANDTYAISYNYTGNLKNFKLYITDKESQTPIDEISLNNGVFQAPEGIYDLQLVFNIDSSSINNYLELWNIQIEANDTISEYEPYNSKELTFDTEEQLLSSGDNVRDLVALKSPNILNSKTQSGTTIPSTKYYLNQAGNTEYHIWYYNNEGNLIVFIDPDGHEASGVVGIRGAFTVHSECTKVTITKSSDPDANDVSQEEIESNQIIISKGDNPIEYYPYFDVPSRVQKVAKKIFNGTESWAISGTEDMPYIYVSDIKPSTMNAICTDYRISDRFKLSNGLFGVSSSKNIVFYNSNYVNKLDEWKSYLVERYNSNNPIVLEYELNTPIVTPLTQDEIEGLSGLLSYDGVTNIYTNNDVLGYNTFNYISSYSEQQTQNAYLQLKCYNANTLYYFIHSNYIEIPEDIDKVFIWLRRKNNLFDLKIENLGDYKEEDHPTDITKPVVTLDINLNDITQSEIPVSATCIDETGLRTVRFSKDNGISWDEVVPVDGLSTNNSYVFKNLSADTFYTIRVEAIDLSGNIGGMSQRVTTKA